MPQLSLPEALRYFFSPFVIMFYFCIYDPATAKDLIKDFGVIPAVASLVAGITIYYVYRYCIYNDFIMPLYDYWRRKDNHRIFIMQRFTIPRSFWSSTHTTNKIIHELSDDEQYSAAMTKRGRPVRAAGLHLLYQSGIIAIVFCALSLISTNLELAGLFFLAACVQIFTAWRMDMIYEDEELIVVNSMLTKLDVAASKVLARRPPHDN